MKKEKSFKVKKNIKAEDTEKLGYETRTMEKDIEDLKKKLGIIDSKKLPEPPAPPKPKAGLPRAKKSPKTHRLPEAPRPPSGPEALKGRRPKKRKRKTLVLFITIVIILLIVGGVIYWWNYLRVPEELQPTADQPASQRDEPQAGEIPVSLIEVDTSGIVEIKEGEDEALFGKLKERAAQEQEQGTFQRILIKNIGPEKDHFLSFQEIAEILYINIPLNILNSLTEEHTLFLYSQKEGNRLGVITKVRDTQNLADYLKSWEETMETDLALFFLDKKINESIGEEFKDNIYNEVELRYLNFPDPSLTIDYAVVENYLIITTSMEGMYGVIDKIIKGFVYEDCGSSDSCFSDYVKTCTPAKAIVTETQDSVELAYQETIEGFDNDNCILTLVYTKSPISGFVGKEMTCRVPKDNLDNFKDYLQGERMEQSCEGPLLDFIIQMRAE